MNKNDLAKRAKALNNPLQLTLLRFYFFGSMPKQSDPALVDFSHPAFCFVAAMRLLQGSYQQCEALGVPPTFEAVVRRLEYFFVEPLDAEKLAKTVARDIYDPLPSPFNAESIPFYANLLTAMVPAKEDVAMIKACIRGVSTAIRGTNDIHYKE
ncbi:MAG: hypothetical protein KBT39_00040 [Bacteroidales bacterium]|nr:hypothetical protein [Bacteroidales bacterium]